MSYLFDVFETRGISGNVYRFEIFSKWQRFEKNISAVYAFLAQDEKNPYQLKILYIGQSEDLDHRLTNHNKWSEAVKRGFSHLVFFVCPLPNLTQSNATWFVFMSQS